MAKSSIVMQVREPLIRLVLSQHKASFKSPSLDITVQNLSIRKENNYYDMKLNINKPQKNTNHYPLRQPQHKTETRRYESVNLYMQNVQRGDIKEVLC
jgi:hypothetical protein